MLGAYFHKLISARVTTVNTVACTNAAQTFVNTSLQVVGSISPLDQNLSIIAGASTTFGNQLVAMRDACFMGVTGDAITHLATVSGRSEASLRAAMPVEMRTVIEAQTVITGWFNAVLEGRKKLREIEASFQTMTGVPWGRLRYFTTEEAADDSAARTMVELGMTPEGGSLLLINDNAALASVCTPMLAGTTQVPYGQHLQDEHHATCWRAKHQAQIGADTSGRKIDWSPIDVSIFGPLPDAPVFMD